MKKNKKILFLVNNLSFFISHRLLIAEALIVKGFDVVIGYGEIGNINLSFVKKKGMKVSHVPIHRGSINPFKEFKTIFHIWKFFKKEKADLVHLITIKPYLYGGILARLLKIQCLVSAVSGLGTLFINRDLKSRFLRLLTYPFFKLAFNHLNQKVIIQNKDDLSVLVEWGVLDNLKVNLIKGSGVKLENFKKLDELRKIPTVCFAARLLREKGVYEFVSAAHLLKERGIKVNFYLAGDVDNKNPSGLKYDDIKELKKYNIVNFLGYIDDIPSLYASSNIICLPSYREGFPKSLIEAAAASRAVVTTDVPGCRDAIIPNKTGLLVPVRNPEKLADAIEWLINNPNERISMGKAGRKLAEKEFRIEKIIENHMEIYKELLN